MPTQRPGLEPVTSRDLITILDDPRFSRPPQIETDREWQAVVEEMRRAVASVDLFLSFNPANPDIPGQVFAPMKAALAEERSPIVERWSDKGVKRVREEMNVRLRIPIVLGGHPGLGKLVDKIHSGETPMNMREFCLEGAEQSDLLAAMDSLVRRFGSTPERIALAWSYIEDFLSAQSALPLDLKIDKSGQLSEIHFDEDLQRLRLTNGLILSRLDRQQAEIEGMLVTITRLRNAARVGARLASKAIEDKKTLPAGVDELSTARVLVDGFDPARHIGGVDEISKLTGATVTCRALQGNIFYLTDMKAGGSNGNGRAISVGDLYRFRVGVEGTPTHPVVTITPEANPGTCVPLRDDLAVQRLFLLKANPQA